MDIFSIYKTMPETHKENLKSYYIFKGIYDCFPDIDEEDAKFIYKITSKVENENINPYSISHYLTDHYTRGNLTKKDFHGLCFVNLVDFDALYGHRRNVVGYHDALVEFDSDLKILMNNLNDDDLLIITADHGNDPTWTGTDHTREYVPLLVYSKSLNKGDLGIRSTFADIGATISENFNILAPKIGKSFLKEIK